MYECDYRHPQWGRCEASHENHYSHQFKEFDAQGRFVRPHTVLNDSFVTASKIKAEEFNEFAVQTARDVRENRKELSDPTENTVGAMHHEPHDTEAAAAYAVMPRTGTQRWTVLMAIAEAGDNGLNDDEIAAVTGIYRYSAAPRRNELLVGGWIEDSGIRRDSGRGNDAAVWVLSAEGRARLAGEAPQRVLWDMG